MLFRCVLVSFFFVGFSCSVITRRPPVGQFVNANDLLKEKCERNARSEDAYSFLRNKTRSFFPCLRNLTSSIKNPEVQWRDGCRILEGDVYAQCFLPAIESIVPCINSQEFFFLEYLNSTYKSIIENFCVDVIADKLKEAKRLKTEELCLGRHYYVRFLSDTCLQNLKIVSNILNRQLTETQTEMCNDLDIVRHCITNFISEHCSENFRNMVEFAINPFFEWCQKV